MKMVRAVGVLALLVVVVAIWMAIVSAQFDPAPPEGLPGKFMGRGLAMQFAATSSDVEKILAPNVANNSEVMQKVLAIDFLWIVCYGSLFATISVLLFKRNCPWARHLGIVALVAGLAAAAFDVRENLGILQLISHSPYEQVLINNVRESAALKWTFNFVATAILAIAFQDLDNKLADWISISFVVTSLVGFAGLWRHPLLAVVPIPLLIGLLLLTITAFIWPKKLKENPR